MKHKAAIKIGGAALCVAMVFAATARGQRRSSLVSSRQTAYETARETNLQGTVLTYTENSQIPPMGAHVTVQTANGPIDVHLGPASYLRSNHFALSAGDFVSFVGVSVTTNEGRIFLARIAQKGNESIVIRSPRGSLQAVAAARASPQAQRAHRNETVGPR